MAVNYYKHKVTCAVDIGVNTSGQLYYLSTSKNTCGAIEPITWFNDTYKSGMAIPAAFVGNDGELSIMYTVHSIDKDGVLPSIFVVPNEEMYLSPYAITEIISDELVD